MREFSLTAHLNVIKFDQKEQGLKAMQAKRGMFVFSFSPWTEKKNGFENNAFGNNG